MSDQVIQQFELLIGSIGVVLALFFGAYLIIDKDKQPKANIFLAIYLLVFALRIGKSLFHNYYDISPILRTYILSTLYCIGPSIWLYVSYLKEQKQRIDVRDLNHYLPFVIISVACYWIPNDGSSPFFSWFYDGTIIHLFSYTAFTFWWISSLSKKQSPAKEKWLKPWLIFFLLANIALIIIYFLVSKVFLELYIGISIAFSLVIVLMAGRALKSPELFSRPRKKYEQSSKSRAQMKELAQRINQLMEEEKFFLHADLKLQSIAKELKVSTKEVSQAINQVYDMNFSNYVAQYRIEEVKRRLKDKKLSHLSIAAIAHDSGYNSLSTFNEQFRRITGSTAQAFRKES